MKQAWHIVEPATPFVDNWHLGCICEHLQAMTALEIRKLVINIPPRHAKSLIASVFWFCWVWTREPHTRWLYSSYGEDLSSRDSVKCRDILVSDWYRRRWPGMSFLSDDDPRAFSLKNDQNVKTWFANDRQGYRIATTVEGKATGHGGDYIVTDDPHKVQEARSAVRRVQVTDWWTQAMSTRGNDPKTARFLVVMQRLHERDLTGYLIAEELGYEHLCLPAEYERGRVMYSLPEPGTKLPKETVIATSLQRDELRCNLAAKLRGATLRDPRKEEGELLWPQRFDAEAVADWKKTLKEYGWAGQGQQRPSPPEGTIFKRDYFRYFRVEMHQGEAHFVWGLDKFDPNGVTRVPVRACRFFQAIDTASSEDETAAYTAVGTFAVTPQKRLLVFHVWRMRLEVPLLFPTMRAIKDGPVVVMTELEVPKVVNVGEWPKALMFQAVEKAQSGIGLIQQGWAAGHPFHPLQTDGDKVERAGPVATMYLNGQVLHHEGQEWLTDYEDELLTFPSGAFKDMADVTSYAGILVTHERILSAQVEDGRIYAERPEELRQALREQASGDETYIEGVGKILWED
jgi:phage terminase large subunit-like protein